MADEVKADASAAKSDDSAAQPEFLKAEAAKAYKARDEAKAKLRELEGRVLSDDDRALFDKLKADSEKAAEERKRKAGEFDTWRADITKKHEEAIQKATARAEQAEVKFRQKLVGLAFAGATDLFSDTGKTVLTADIAEAYFGRYVDVLADEQGVESVVVKGPDGHVILNAKTGKPAAFAEALAEVIEGLPHKDKILRGSGKAGSGSSGGSNGTREQVLDVANLTPEQRRDPKVLDLLRKQRPRGGMVVGEAYQR